MTRHEGRTTETRPVERIETVVVVGGGDAGLITALLLKNRNPSVKITIVDDFDEPVPQVGKSTITYILNTFHNVLDIDKQRFIDAVKPIWKASVYFEDWCGCDPFHVPFDDAYLLPTAPGERRFEELHHRYATQQYRTRDVEIAEQRKTPFLRTENGEMRTYEQVAYHLGTNRLNSFLRAVCRERGVALVDDVVTTVRTTGDRIDRVESEEDTYEADLYVDATGFSRTLVGALPREFRSFDVPLDAALVAKTPLSLDDIIPATVIRTGEHGWFWQIDTYDWRDLGYVYASEFVSNDDAATEFVERFDGVFSASDVREFRFDSGVYDAAWVGNCVAVGNALGFVEPLQSTALTLNAIATEKLADLIADHHRIDHEGVRDVYNTYTRNLWRNVYDFVSLHYRYAPGNGAFWEAMRTVNDTETLSETIENYRMNGFSSHDAFDERRGPVIFNQFIFYRVLRNLGVGSDFYESVDIEAPPEVVSDVRTRDATMQEEVATHLTYEEFYGKPASD